MWNIMKLILKPFVQQYDFTLNVHILKWDNVSYQPSNQFDFDKKKTYKSALSKENRVWRHSRNFYLIITHWISCI